MACRMGGNRLTSVRERSSLLWRPYRLSGDLRLEQRSYVTAQFAASRIPDGTGGACRRIAVGTGGFASIGVLAFLLVTGWPAAAAENPCEAAPTVADASVTLSLADGRTRFHSGEIIPLALSFTSSAKNRYWAEDRNYDRSGRLSIEKYCVAPELPDPLDLIP